MVGPVNGTPQHLDQPVTEFIRHDFAQLREAMTTREALEAVRREGVGEKIVYFYVVDEEQRLVGVLPTRRLLTAEEEQRIGDLMIKRVVAIPQSATLLEACEFFVLHKFFAFPVVDGERRILGVIDVGVFTEEVFDIAEREQHEDVFETIGFHVSQVRDAGPIRAFRYRFPWLLATIASGTACALLASVFALTLAQSLVIAFFLTLVLGLGESVSIQSMAVTIQALRTSRPTMRWYLQTLRREVGTALLLGLACGVLVGAIVWFWRGEGWPALAIGGSIVASLVMACVLGLSIPSVLHASRLDPKIAAGPLTLALADVLTLLFYFSIARLLLAPA
ncbi:MAG: magnesium transporter [Verrucomicrobiota bacterium]|nr:magnesium transporter [Verrucomicrobiota bacterium]